VKLVCEYRYASLGYEERLPQGVLEYWAQDECHYQRSGFIVKLLKKIADNPKDEHNEYIKFTSVDAVRSNNA
jgi:hypothetical protein